MGVALTMDFKGSLSRKEMCRGMFGGDANEGYTRGRSFGDERALTRME